MISKREMMHMDENGGMFEAPSNRRRVLLRLGGLAVWVVLMGIVISSAVRSPSLVSIISAAAFLLLFGVVYAQIMLVDSAGRRGLRHFHSRMGGGDYIDDRHELPNRNYLLAELRREMPRARNQGVPFVVLVVTLDELGGIRERRGEDFAERAVVSLSDLLRRVTRQSDFLSYIEGSEFAVVLNECDRNQAIHYLRRLPGTLAVSDGRRMFDVAIAIRLHEYDMESLYATDVLKEAEASIPLRRRKPNEDREAA
jgi:diguanylate cyclase (GGDEF)-like protein